MFKKVLFFLAVFLGCFSCTLSQPGIPSRSPTVIHSPSLNPGNPNQLPLNPANPNQLSQNPINPLNPQDPNQPTSPTAPTVQVTSRNKVYPFDLVIDTLAYMNCPASQVQDRDLFTFKFASLEEGIRLSDEFLDNIAEEKNTTQKKLLQKDIEPVLKQSPFLHSRAQISLNPQSNLAHAVTQYANVGHGALSFNSEIEKMSRFRRVKTLVNGVPFITSFLAAGNQVYQVATYLAQHNVFFLSYRDFAPGDENPNIYAYGFNPPKYYGRTYGVKLEGGQDSLRYLSEVEEKYAITQEREGRWTCNSRSRLPILRHESVLKSYKGFNEWFLLQDPGLKEKKPELECHDIVSDEAKQKLRSLDQDKLDLLLPRFKVGEMIAFSWDATKSPENTGDLCLVPLSPQTRCYNSPYRIEFEKEHESECEWQNSKRVNECPAYFSFCERN